MNEVIGHMFVGKPARYVSMGFAELNIELKTGGDLHTFAGRGFLTHCVGQTGSSLLLGVAHLFLC